MAALHTTLDARERLLVLINACWTTQAIATAVSLGLPQRLDGNAQSAASLAEACGCDAAALRRLLRALAALGVISECDDGRFALAAAGRPLLPDAADSLHAWARLRASHWAGWDGLLDSVKTGRGLRERNGGRADFAHLDHASETAALFHRAMTELTRRIAPALLRALTLRGDEHVMDIGGGHGELLATLAHAHPALRGEVFDQAHARAGALARFEAEGLQSRCGFVAGDFFACVPEGAAVYLLKSVLHDWDDAHAVELLQRCSGALTAPGARLVIVERIAPERVSATPRHVEICASDLNMLVHLGGRERSVAEFSGLLARAGLRVIARTELPAAFELIEAAPC
jgi:hypothetical protein